MRVYVGAYVAVWVVFAAASGMALGHVRCTDLIAPDGTIYAALSTGPRLPVPSIQSCHASAMPLFAVLALAYAALTWLWMKLLAFDLPVWMLGALAVTVNAVAIAFPYVSTTDAYAYALYAYEAGVLHLSPYAAHVLPANALTASLNALFPTLSSDVRLLNYGPSFALAYAAVGSAFGRTLPSLIYGERFFSALCGTLTAVFLALASERNDRKRVVTAIVLSPLLLIEGVAFAHADLLMLVLLAAAYLAWHRGANWGAGALAGAAMGARSIAVIALAGAFVYAVKSGNRARAFPLLAGAAVALCGLAAVSYLAFGTVSFGGGAALDPYGSPMAMAANLLGGVDYGHTVVAAGLQVALGLTLAGLAMLNANYDLVPLAALAAAPSLRPWYCQWAVPMLALPVSQRANRAATAIVFLAILSEAPLAIDGSLAIAGTVMLLQWTVPVVTLALANVRTLGVSSTLR